MCSTKLAQQIFPSMPFYLVLLRITKQSFILDEPAVFRTYSSRSFSAVTQEIFNVDYYILVDK